MTRKLIALAAGLLLAAPAVAQSGGDYALTWWTIDGGGGVSSGGGYELTGTIGQPDASSQSAPLAGGEYGLIGGFWVHMPLTCTAHAPFDFDEDCDVDLADLDSFAACARGPVVLRDPAALCARADVDLDDDVDQDDFAAFQRCYSGMLAADPDCAE